MKKMIACLALAGLIFTFAACGSAPAKDGDGNNTVAVQQTVSNPGEIVDLLAEKVSFEDTMTKVDGDAAIGRYGVDESYTGDCALYISTMATPEEVAVFRMDATHDASYFKSLAESYLEQQKASYTDYAPQHLPKLDSAVMGAFGDYFVVCVSADNAEAASVLNALMGA